METKELKIQVPEGYEIDKEKSTFENIVFKKKDSKPRSWEEYCKNTTCGYYINSESGLTERIYSDGLDCNTDKNILPSEELAEAFLAMMQLMSLRQAWIGDWKPDWKHFDQPKAAIRCDSNCEFIVICFKDLVPRSLSFPTEEMALDFMNCFKDLLKTAKSLI